MTNGKARLPLMTPSRREAVRWEGADLVASRDPRKTRGWRGSTRIALRGCGLRRTKQGRTFYGCRAYPKCDFTLWNRPVPEPCPACGAKFLVEKRLKGGVQIQCAAEGCEYQREAASPAPAEAGARS